MSEEQGIIDMLLSVDKASYNLGLVLLGNRDVMSRKEIVLGLISRLLATVYREYGFPVSPSTYTRFVGCFTVLIVPDGKQIYKATIRIKEKDACLEIGRVYLHGYAPMLYAPSMYIDTWKGYINIRYYSELVWERWHKLII